MPALIIKVVKIVTPVKFKFVTSMVPSVHLDVVVKEEPGHIAGIEAMAP